MAFKKGDFVKWTSHDFEGKFSHTGEIVAIDESGTTLNTEFGLMKIHDEDGVMVHADKPDNWGAKPVSIIKPEMIPQVMVTQKAVRQPRQSNGESKKDRAIAMYKGMMINGDHPARQQVIEKFVSELGMTPAGASTYAAMAKKESQ